MNNPFHDPHAVRLLSRVREDLAQLRHDISTLASHTTHRTLPGGARDLAENARHHLSSGTAFAADRLRAFRQSPPREALGVAGGVVAVGLIALGIYALCSGRRKPDPYSEEDYQS